VGFVDVPCRTDDYVSLVGGRHDDAGPSSFAQVKIGVECFRYPVTKLEAVFGPLDFISTLSLSHRERKIPDSPRVIPTQRSRSDVSRKEAIVVIPSMRRGTGLEVLSIPAFFGTSYVVGLRPGEAAGTETR
jgi:hypothetical protein